MIMDTLSAGLAVATGGTSAFLSLLGGSAFRMLWGELSAYFTRKQEHAQEVERMKLQGELADKEHARNIETIRVQSDLGIKLIEVQRDADISRTESDAWASLVESTAKKTGYKAIDVWNMAIRPLLASFAILVVAGDVIRSGFVLSEWVMELVSAILGIYLADRSLSKRGK